VYRLIKSEAGVKIMKNKKDHADYEKATFAGGCFWCMEHPFEKLDGVVEVVSGYTGGHTENPTYEEVCTGKTGHAEAVQIIYDPSKISYPELLDMFWRQINPTDSGGQFFDRGSTYRTEIFYHTEEQKRLAEVSKEALETSGPFPKKIVTQITPAGPFYKAEDYHQKYYQKNPLHYQRYRHGSGRDAYLTRIWGVPREKRVAPPESSQYAKLADGEIKKKLTPLQYEVTQKGGTEKPFDNKYCDNKKEGIYVDIVSGEPLFSSHDKFDSGTGWPSFTQPLVPDNVVEVEDNSFFMKRTEIKSKHAGSHLGHVFNDGPAPTGLRFCMNSASLRFIPKEDLEKEGYGEYAKLFVKQSN